MKRKTPKTMYVVMVTRGSRTIYKYAAKLSEACEAARLRLNEEFTYTKYVAGKETKATWYNGVIGTER